MTDLASLHASEGHPELARWFQLRIASYRAQNPYYRFEQARRDYAAGDYDGSARELREALRYSDVDPTFYSLLGMSYRELGRSDAARAAFTRAIELAEDETSRNAYRRKLELLGSSRARATN
jgi:Flp pilus assembly protein TadD